MAVLFQLACPRDLGPRFERSVPIFGYQAKLEGSNGVVHLVDVDHPIRAAWPEHKPIPKVTLVVPGRLAQAIEVVRTEVRAGRRLLWLAPLPLALGERAALDVGRHRTTLQMVRPAEKWPTVLRAMSAKADAMANLRELSKSSTTTLERLAAKKELARAFSKKGDARGYRDTQVERAADARLSGLITEAANALSAAAYYAYTGRDYDDVEALATKSIALSKQSEHLVGEARAELMRAYAFHDLGRYRSSLKALDRAADRAWASGDDSDLAWVEKARVGREDEIGLQRGTTRRLERLGAYFQGASDRARLSYLTDLGWIRSRAMARGDTPADWSIPRGELMEALRIARELKVRDSEQSILASLAWLNLASGDFEQARRRVKEVRATKIESPRVSEAYADLLSARIEFATNQSDKALVAARRAVETAYREAGGRATEHRWRAQYLLGRVLKRQGQKGAQAAFDRAMNDVEAIAHATGIRDFRASFFDDRSALYDSAIEAALASQSPKRAFAIAARSRALLIRGFLTTARQERLSLAAGSEFAAVQRKFFEARQRVDALRRTTLLIPADRRRQHERQLARGNAEVREAFETLHAWRDENLVHAGPPPTAKGIQDGLEAEAVLVACYARRDQDRLCFRVAQHSVRTVHDPKTKEAWRAIVADNKTLYLSSGVDRARDFLDAADAVLDVANISLLPIAESLNVPRRAVSKAQVLVVADPESNLTSARREGKAIAARFPQSELVIGDEASSARVWRSLEHASRLHFAGHAVHSVDDPWQAHLELADGDRITLEDLLAAPTTLEHAVLNGCGTGEARRTGTQFVLGLPDALILSGSRTVLATFHDVNDGDAEVFVRAFYEAGGDRDPVAAYRTAAIAERAARQERWRAFYVMGARG